MVQEIRIEQINPAPYNPRVQLEPGMAEWDKLKENIKREGLVEPLVWNQRTGNLVGGHQRLAIIKELGWETVPCSVVDLDEYDEKILNMALNKIKGRWDYDKLEELLSEFDRDIAERSGFAAEEIATILANNDDLLDDDDEDYYDWDDLDDEEEATIVGGSYVVTLVFASRELAAMWAENEGYEKQVKDGSSTTVIRVEE